MSLVGYVIEDADGDGVRSAGDRPGETLVQISVISDGYIDSGAVLKTDGGGRFQFDDLCPGDYEFTVWWSPGFVGVQGTFAPDEQALHPVGGTPVAGAYAGMLKLKIAVGGDGAKTYSYVARESDGDRVRLRDLENAPVIPSGVLVILGNANTQGLIPFPIVSGDGTGIVPVGRVSLRQVSMPSSGSGDDAGDVSTGWWLVGIGSVLLAGATVFLYAERRFKGRRA
jgi:hypothetical protein